MDKLPNREEAEQLAVMAGLDLPSPYNQELAEAYAHVRRMVNRIPREWTYSDEPAHVFMPTKFGARRG